MPDTVRAQDIARLVDEDVEGQAGVLDVAPDRVARLREDADDLDPARVELREMRRKLTKLVAAVRSPGAAMKREQQRPAREELRQRPRTSFLVRQREFRRAGQPRRVHQNSFTSTISPASTMSTCAGMSMYPSARAMLVMSPDALNAGTAAPSTMRTV